MAKVASQSPNRSNRPEAPKSGNGGKPRASQDALEAELRWSMHPSRTQKRFFFCFSFLTTDVFFVIPFIYF